MPPLALVALLLLVLFNKLVLVYIMLVPFVGMLLLLGPPAEVVVPAVPRCERPRRC